jgi:hypothetical protein
MEKLFTKEGEVFEGAVIASAKGKPGFKRLVTCGRCGGSGHYSYCSMYGTTCFGCRGSGNRGWEVARLYSEAELAKLNAAAEKRRAKKAAKVAAAAAAAKAEAEVAMVAFMAVNAELVASAKAIAGKNRFVDELLEKLESGRVWSEKMVAAVAKSVAEISERARLAAGSEFVAKIGERIEIKVKVERVASYVRRSFSGYGEETVRISTLRDEAGNAIVVKSPSFWVEKGEEFVVRATVKEHSEYNGEKQTVVMRAKVLGEIKEIAA